MNAIKEVAIQNARDAAPDLKLVEEGRRKVNGIEVIMLRMEGTSSGIPLTYLGYYYAGPVGTIQVVTWTGRSLFAEHRTEMEAFMNGFRLR